ncbi:506_t:CDS:2 [Cetraspora pellucida]|uniref:506_t:CDS:1 n=1 Tax=Cetraspora pellucida TaxID=1433469 RepID=A0ACA9LUX4_9GLOM|nr:506_t:CDS:2 [Cetraspora pellucida]
MEKGDVCSEMVIAQVHDIKAAADSSPDSYDIDININEDPNEAYDIEAAADSSPDGYEINRDEDPNKEACAYIESNWELFTQAFEQICSERSANN